MASQILTTKLYIPPPRPDLVLRPRLFECLQRGLERKLTLISAPAGYGKTTLLSAWISQLNQDVAWLSLDEFDNDIGRFIDYLIAAMQIVEPDLGKTIPKLIDASDAFSANNLITSFINEILITNKDYLFVLDDFHVISERDVHALMIFLIENLPPNLHLMIASRTDPPIQVARLRVTGDLSEIRANDLRFTQNEAVEFFHQLKDYGLDPKDVGTLVEKTEGWITGLQLACISLQNYPNKQAFLRAFAGDDRHIADYLFEEVLGSLPAYIQSFLLDTSILDRLCASLCNAVTGREDSQEILSALEQTNLFLIPLDNRRQWYRYHRLFGDLLNLSLKKKAPSTIPALHIRASEWYQNQGFFNLSVTHAIKAEDIKLVEKFVRENTLGMLEIGETKTVDRWLCTLPQDTVQKSLWLTIARGWTLVFSGKIDAAEAALQNLETQIFKDDVDPDQLKRASGQIAALRAYVADLRGDPSLVESCAIEALEKLSEDDLIAKAFSSMMLATAYNRQGDTQRAEVALQDALITSEIRPNSFVAIDSLCMLSGIQRLRGMLYESEATLKRVLDLSFENIAMGNRQFPITGLAYIYLGQIYYEWNRLGEALNSTKQGLDLLEPWGYSDCVIVGLMRLTSIYLAMRDIHQAIEIIRKAKRISDNMPYWMDRVASVEAWVAALNGDQHLATSWVNAQYDLLQREPEIHLGLIYRNYTKTIMQQGKYADAAGILRKVAQITQDRGANDRLIRTLTLMALALLGQGDEEEALDHLIRAIELAEPGGYVRVFLDAGEPLYVLLYQAAQKGIHPQYCMRILREAEKDAKGSIGIMKVGDQEETIDMVEPLSEREIEVLKYIAQGFTNQEVAQELVLSLYTVKSHARNIYSKLGVKNRTEAVTRARLLGLLPEG
ncbi:MAG: LuxR C-terminal-related transcriptional regulator [Anaerolineales bacterium]